MTVGILGGNVAGAHVGPIALAPASVAANTTAEQTFAVNGLRPLDAVFVCKPTLQAGLGVVNARVSALNTLAITYSNNTGSPIVPTTETYVYAVFRSDAPAMGVSI